MISLSVIAPLSWWSVACFLPVITANYILQDDYTPDTFLTMVDFFTGIDPTGGYVNYLNQSTAEANGLIGTSKNQFYMGVDSSNVAQGLGRDSVRITSTNSYNHGLFILDLAHMPGGTCGTWPAFWMVGPNWPNDGEVDIIENVNSATTNQMSLHTNASCTITNNGLSSSTILYADCNASVAGNAGCSFSTPNMQTYGTGFNDIGGGVYATEWTSQSISIWFFPRDSIPADILSGTPNPSGWGLALAEFSGECDLDQHILDQQIVFDTTFCGWAASVWTTDPICSAEAATCQDYVQNNPADFQETYWAINDLKVYQDNDEVYPTSTLSAVATSATISTSFITLISSSAPAITTTPTTFSSITTSTYSTIPLILPPFLHPGSLSSPCSHTCAPE